MLKKDVKKEFKRKLIHLSSLWIPLVVYILHPSQSLFLFSTLFIADAILEYGNFKKWGWARFLFGKFFTATLRRSETNKSKFIQSGSLYVLMAAMACSLLFPKPIAVLALIIMLVSDTCAALVGKTYGIRKIRNSKTLEGTSAFFLSSLLIMIAFNPLYPVSYASIIACMAATLAELFEDKLEIDDNLSISLSVGIVLSFLS